MQDYLECHKKAHETLLSMLFNGHKYQVMLDAPIFSKDVMYGVP
jgi:hypothetical protein